MAARLSSVRERVRARRLVDTQLPATIKRIFRACRPPSTRRKGSIIQAHVMAV